MFFWLLMQMQQHPLHFDVCLEVNILAILVVTSYYRKEADFFMDPSFHQDLLPIAIMIIIPFEKWVDDKEKLIVHCAPCNGKNWLFVYNWINQQSSLTYELIKKKVNLFSLLLLIKLNRIFFLTLAMSVLLYGWTIWTLKKTLRKN